jgi:hypothetical protein
MTTKQHTGILSDAIVNEDGPARDALRRIAKPTGRAFRGKSDIGNGEVCPWDAERQTQHGKMFRMASGNDWCPNVDHSAGKLK